MSGASADASQRGTITSRWRLPCAARSTLSRLSGSEGCCSSSGMYVRLNAPTSSRTVLSHPEGGLPTLSLPPPSLPLSLSPSLSPTPSRLGSHETRSPSTKRAAQPIVETHTSLSATTAHAAHSERDAADAIGAAPPACILVSITV
eukprot:scaffold1504_cov34-Tisochrysis_lutea.AAC.6